mmetsp:Transcript_49938/g.156312  ORF Transcript_49938/g.156312 Transcript_49938/m.156312 type:complete len:141 (+) Transcript_49938:1171-1593(+)
MSLALSMISLDFTLMKKMPRSLKEARAPKNLRKPWWQNGRETTVMPMIFEVERRNRRLSLPHLEEAKEEQTSWNWTERRIRKTKRQRKRKRRKRRREKNDDDLDSFIFLGFRYRDWLVVASIWHDMINRSHRISTSLDLA